MSCWGTELRTNEILPYGKQSIDASDINSVIEVLKSPYLTQGPLVDKFEQELACYLNAKHVVAVSNGTAALHLAALALGFKKGDAIIVPAITFVATSNAALYCGATPVFADIDINSGNISIESAEEAYQLAKKKGLNVRAIFPVHYSGLPCNISEIINFSKKYHLKIVEDSCHALGAQYRKDESDGFNMVGSFADMAVWSFHPVKHITTGEGGAISTNDPELAQKLRMLRTHGITKEPGSFLNKEFAIDPVTLGTNPWYHEMHLLGFNYRLPDILCALGISQLKKIPLIVERRQEIASYYKKNFIHNNFIKNLNHPQKNSISSYHLFPLQIDFESLGLSRAQVMSQLKELGVGTQVHYIPIPFQPYYRNNPDIFLQTEIPNAIRFYKSELSIPMYFDLTVNDLDKVIGSINSVIK